MIKLRTDHKWRPFRYRYEVPKRVLQNQLDWTTKDHEASGDYSDGFVKRYRDWHHVSEFTQIGGIPELSKWHGILHYSFSSGLVIRLSPDGEEYQIAYYWVTSSND